MLPQLAIMPGTGSVAPAKFNPFWDFTMDAIADVFSNYFSSPLVVFGFLSMAIPGLAMVACLVLYKMRRQANPYSQSGDMECFALVSGADAAPSSGAAYYPVSDMKCDATIDGYPCHRTQVHISARSLPKEGDVLRAMCKCTWPKITANGWKDQEPHYRWAEVTVKQGDILIKEIPA